MRYIIAVLTFVLLGGELLLTGCQSQITEPSEENEYEVAFHPAPFPISQTSGQAAARPRADLSRYYCLVSTLQPEGEDGPTATAPTAFSLATGR